MNTEYAIHFCEILLDSFAYLCLLIFIIYNHHYVYVLCYFCNTHNVINLILCYISMLIKITDYIFSAWKVMNFLFGLWIPLYFSIGNICDKAWKKRFFHNNRLKLYFFYLFLEDNDMLREISITKYS